MWIESSWMVGDYLEHTSPLVLQPTFSIKVYKSCTIIENLLTGMYFRAGKNPEHGSRSRMFMKSAPLQPHEEARWSSSQNLLLTVNMGFSAFKSRTELSSKVRLLRGFVPLWWKHAPGKMRNGLAGLPEPSPHTVQFMLNQHYSKISNNCLHTLY